MIFNINSNSSTTKETPESLQFHPTYNGNPIKVVSQYKYLGVDLTSDLSFEIMKKRMILKARRNGFRYYT